MKKQLIMLALVAAATGFFEPATRAETAPAEQVQQIISAFNDRKGKLTATTNEQHFDDVVAEYNRQVQECSQHLIRIVLADPTAPTSEEGLRWVIANSQPSAAEFEQSLILYERYFATCAKFRQVCPFLKPVQSKAAEPLLRKVMKKNEAEDVRGTACFILAKRLQLTNPKESQRLFNLVVRKYADVRAPDKTSTLGFMAQQALYEIQHLSIGKTAPEISGTDVEGKPFKLSDYRGKIVMVDFYGDW